MNPIISRRLRIGVLRGGPSPEYDVSLKSGANILKELSKNFEPLDIFIDKKGDWYLRGKIIQPENILPYLDVVWNSLHGTYGEDGTVQYILESHKVPFTGSSRLPSAISMNKKMTKDIVRGAGIKTPIEDIVRKGEVIKDRAKTIYNTIPRPHVIKPIASGSSLSLHFSDSLGELISSLENVLQNHEAALVEEYVSGREATCAVLENFRGKEIYSFPVVEIIPLEKSKFFDYSAKYSGQSQEICPGRFSDKEKRQIEEISATVHKNLGLSHYSRSDFIVSPERGIYFLEVNTLPGMTEESLLPKSIESVGLSMEDFIHHVLFLALRTYPLSNRK